MLIPACEYFVKILYIFCIDIVHILNRYCGKDSAWGLPPMQSTPAPVNYVYSKDNRPKTDEDKAEIEKRFKGLSMASAVSSLLYAALNTRSDILWITNKLAKSSSCPGIKDFEALLHVFGYIFWFMLVLYGFNCFC